MSNLPDGVVTFLFSDVEGSTNIAQAHPEAWEALRTRHYEIVRGAIVDNKGHIFQLVGDEFCAAFHSVSEALNAALQAQKALQTEKWDPAPVKVRMGIHTGPAQLGDLHDTKGGYTGYATLACVNRIMSAGHGGQILLSNASAEFAREKLPKNVDLKDMGEQRLKGLLRPERIWQAQLAGLASEFPQLKTLEAISVVSMSAQLENFIGRGKEIAKGLERLEAELPQRAPILTEEFNKLAGRLRLTLEKSPASKSDPAYVEQLDALKKINDLSLEALDLSFIALGIGEKLPQYEARCPFRGLESFRPEDSEFFFGRDALIQKLAGKLETHPFLVVLGASGSGKSSLVMAGLLPALKSKYAIFRPGSDPLGELKTASSALKKNDVLVVDQFEETFTLTPNEATRREFISRVLEATEKYRVVVTLRSDFLGEVAAYRALNDEIQNHLENVPPMDMDELYQSMAGQAGHVGLRFEADLGQQILDDVQGEPGAMPLLQHALWMLWKRRHGFWLKANEYQAFGGVRQAIASAAEDVYSACMDFERERLRDIFLRLTRLDENNEGRDTRRRVLFEDLQPVGGDASANVLLLDVLANARLIVKTLGDGKTEIEVAHEALIRHWERLRGWLSEDREKLRLRESVGESAKEWEKSGRDEAFLNHRGGRLDDAVALGNNSRYGLTALEQEYLNECVALRNREQLARERRLRWTLIAAVAAAIIFFALGSFGWVQRNEAISQSATAQANEQLAQTNENLARENEKLAEVARDDAQKSQAEAEQQAERALAGSLAAQSNSIKSNNHALALLLGLEAYQREDNLLTRSTLFDLLQFSPYTRLFGYNGPVSSVAVSPDGKWLASTGCREYNANQCKYGDVILSDAATGQPVSKLDGAYGIVYSLAFHQYDSMLLLAAGGCVPADDQNQGCIDYKGQLTLWDLSDASAPAEVANLREGHSALVKTLAFNDDGSLLASGSFDTTVVLWDMSNPAKPAMAGEPLTNHTSFVNSIAFNADGKTLASAGDDKSIILWDVSTPAAATQIGDTLQEHTAPVTSVAFSPDGAKFASASDDKTVILWDWDNAARSLQNPLTLKAHNGYVKTVAFSADGKLLASGGFDNKIILWDAATGAQSGLALNAHTKAVNAAAFGLAASGSYLFTGSDDRTVIQWDLSTRAPLSQPLGETAPPADFSASAQSGDLTASVDGQQIRLGGADKLLSGHTGTINSLNFSPNLDGKILLASASDDETVLLWDITDVNNAELFLKLDSFENPVSAAYFEDGQLITVENNGRGIRWNVLPSNWMERACGAAKINLSSADWEIYIPNQTYRKTCPSNP